MIQEIAQWLHDQDLAQYHENMAYQNIPDKPAVVFTPIDKPDTTVLIEMEEKEFRKDGFHDLIRHYRLTYRADDPMIFVQQLRDWNAAFNASAPIGALGTKPSPPLEIIQVHFPTLESRTQSRPQRQLVECVVRWNA